MRRKVTHLCVDSGALRQHLGFFTQKNCANLSERSAREHVGRSNSGS